MKRSASASFEKDCKDVEVEHIKKITKSVQTKKSAKLHDDDAYPSPVTTTKGS